MKTKIAVLVSGGGTNLQALLDAQKSGVLCSGEIALVVSNNAGAFALERAKNAGVPCLSVLWGFRDREQIGGTVYCETVNCLVPMLEEMACGK